MYDKSIAIESGYYLNSVLCICPKRKVFQCSVLVTCNRTHLTATSICSFSIVFVPHTQSSFVSLAENINLTVYVRCNLLLSSSRPYSKAKRRIG
jgi:hypothetical protein